MFNQIIYFGAPGTGKSYKVKKMLENEPKENIYRVTIHQEYTYSDFVGQLLPVKRGDSINFEFIEGPFIESLKAAFKDSSKSIFLVLEEISRGNVASIFGDIFQLLDRDKNFKSKYPIRNKNIADKIPELIGDEIYLPTNFNIICTVNMNDQNVNPMDTAFKRRFEWRYMGTSPVVDEYGHRLKKLNNPKLVIRYKENTLETNWQSFYTSLNLFITDKSKGLGHSEDKQIGQFFIIFNEFDIERSYSENNQFKENALLNIDKDIKNKLLMYLWEDIQRHSAFADTTLFREDISTFEYIYNNYDNQQIFSTTFLEDFLLPNKELYPYS